MRVGFRPRRAGEPTLDSPLRGLNETERRHGFLLDYNTTWDGGRSRGAIHIGFRDSSIHGADSWRARHAQELKGQGQEDPRPETDSLGRASLKG